MSRPSRIVGWGLAILVALLTTGVVYAEQELYFDAAYGRAQVDDDTLDVAVADDTNAWRIGAGFDFGNNIAVEAGYLSLGDLEDSVDIGPFDGETDGFTVSARFQMPITQALSASARVGGFFWESRLAGPLATFRADGEDLYYGVSLDARLSRNLTLSGEWDRFEFGDSEADVLFAGLRYSF